MSMKKSAVDTICDTPGDSIMDRVTKLHQDSFDQGDLVTKIDGQIKLLLNEITLTDYEKLDQDGVNDLLFNRYRSIYDQINLNAHTYGYAKSPDFRYKSEKL